MAASAGKSCAWSPREEVNALENVKLSGAQGKHMWVPQASTGCPHSCKASAAHLISEPMQQRAMEQASLGCTFTMGLLLFYVLCWSR